MGLLVIILLLVGGVIWLLNTDYATRKVNEAIAAQLQAYEAQYHITVGASDIIWTGEAPPLAVSLSDVLLSTLDGEPVVALAHVRVDPSFWRLLLLEFEPKRIILESPQLHIRKSINGFALVGADGAQLRLPNEWLEDSQGDRSSAQNMTGFDIVNGHVIYEDMLQDVRIESSDLQLVWSVSGGVYQLDLAAPMVMNDSQASVMLHASHDVETQQATIEADVQHINPAQICPLFMSCKELPVLDIGLSGKVAVHVDRLSVLKGAAFNLSGTKGNLAFQPHLPENIPLESIEMSAVIDESLTRVMLKKLSMDMGQTSILASGEVKQEGTGYHVNLDGQADMMPVNDLYKYWPEGLAPDSREWTITSIREGMATKGHAKIRLAPKDFEPDYFPDSAIDAYVNVEHSTVNYIEGYPKAEDVTGLVRFTGETMTADVSGKAMGSSVIPQARVYFPNLNAPGTPVEIELSLQSNPSDILDFIAPPRFDFLQRMKVEATKPSGTIDGTIGLAFDAFGGDTPDSGGINWDKVRYEIEAAYADISGLRIDGSYTLKQGAGTFYADNGKLNAAFKGLVNDAPSDLSYRSDHDASDYNIKTTLSMAQLKAMGMPELEQLSGAVRVDASIARRDNAQEINAVIDLQRAGVDLSRLGYEKAAGVPAKLTLKSKGKRVNAARDEVDVAYVSDALNLNGRASLVRESMQIYSLAFDSIRLDKTDVAVAYLNLPDGYQLDVKGNSLDLSRMYGDESSDAATISNFPPIRLNLDVATIYMPEDQSIRQARGFLHCNEQRCEKAELKANLADNASMEMRIYRHNGRRIFSLVSDNAGALMLSFDITDRMKGGTLNISGMYDEAKDGNPLSGKFVIEDFTLLDAPILGRILNMSSLTGLMETLNSKGMSFDKLRTDFVFVRDVATLKNGRAYGPSVGVVADGEINIGTHRLDIEGSLAPAYMINSFIGNIPLIGEVLVGGKGEGMFAINYSVRGDMDDPTVMANPLSVLTPGFTRRFFDIFDSPPDTTAPE